MSALKIHLDRQSGRYVVMLRDDEFSRVLDSFTSLPAAERYVMEHGDPIPEVRT